MRIDWSKVSWRRWRGVADVLGAALCGAVPALGMLAWDLPGALPGDMLSWCYLALLASFVFITASGICGEGAALPKYVFALSEIATALLVPPWFADAALLFIYIPLFLLLILVLRWRGARIAALPLSLMLTLVLAQEEPAAPEPFPEASFLPTTLLAKNPGARILAAGDDLPVEWWRDLEYVSAVDRADAAFARDAKRSCGKYDLAVAGTVERDDVFRRELYRLLAGALAPDGVLILPVSETALLPRGEWRFSALPGAERMWVAAGRGTAPEVDPEVLDRRLQSFYGDDTGDSRPLLPGAFAALYRSEDAAIAFQPPPERRSVPRAWYWWMSGLAALWLLSRLCFCRNERLAAAMTSGENTASLVLYTLAIVPLWSAAEVYIALPPHLVAAGAGLALLPVKLGMARRRTALLIGTLAGVLPLVPWVQWHYVPICSWCFWMLSAAVVTTGLLGDFPRMTWRGAVFGAIFGAGAWILFSGCGPAALPAALISAAILRIGALVRG